ncbi:protoheme IX farnesyltransferase [Maricaulis sp. W15]|uniref:protoheme IX farnesyltransferase n=1 Tax=Maricaulis sp. W15 TaxID=1772333 RepID=UPI000948A22E|nr:protoheme IX farnesyltransferase [Maricaulis sp. W15]OLF80870.1 protoheme IX farnesyltransferase [Maricaulis sp. W15]
MTQDNHLTSAREGQPTGESLKLTPEQEAARKKRNVVIAWSLVAFMVAVFAITVVRLSENIATGAGA